MAPSMRSSKRMRRTFNQNLTHEGVYLEQLDKYAMSIEILFI